MSTKFYLWMQDRQYRIVTRIARKRCITIQELLRAAVIPEWLMKQGFLQPQKPLSPQPDTTVSVHARADPEHGKENTPTVE